MGSSLYKNQIIRNAEEISRLHARIHEAFKYRGDSEGKRLEWEKACADFHTAYDALAFPGGYTGAGERILAGDVETIEAAICFLECRPYFFRSGYMFEKILRKVKRASLTNDQALRLAVIMTKLEEWKKNRGEYTKITR